MSPAPELIDDDLVLTIPPHTDVLSVISSSEEPDHIPICEPQIYLGSLTIDSMETIDLHDDDEPPSLTQEPNSQLKTCSAPSTPTGERDPPAVAFRSSSMTTINNESNQIEIKYHDVKNNGDTNSDDNNSLIATFFGCFKPIFSAVNKIGENITGFKSRTNTLLKTTDDWEIPIDSIINDLMLIGIGIEGKVYRGKLAGQIIACKRVKSEAETNIKHLRKLNHINVIKFRGISISPPLYYIVMEYCSGGSLYEELTRRRERNSCTKPTQVLDWSKQISNGVNYLHSHKIVHRDLKSPNILIVDGNILKISDFGTSKPLQNKKEAMMSLHGTAAWMAPEVIRREPCSEKVDVWSFGVVVWEILTCTVPYHNIDPNAVIWGVGKGNLTLPIPSSAPEGLKLLMSMCWNQRPSNRPSFQQIIKHLNISEREISLFEQEQEYAELTRRWSVEINERLAPLPTIDISATLKMSNDELLEKRKEELQHIVDIRSLYQNKLQQVNKIYIELLSLMMQLKQREREIKKKERILNIKHPSSGNKNGTKGTSTLVSEARRIWLESINKTKTEVNRPNSLNQSSKISRTSIKPNNPLSNNAPSSSSIWSTSVNNQDSSTTKSTQRRRKHPAHRRNNSKGSSASWAPPSLSVIADRENERASQDTTSQIIEERYPRNETFDCSTGMIPMTSIQSAIPSISANIDTESSSNTRQLNPKTLKLEIQNSNNSQISPITHQQPTTIFTYDKRKSSSSDPEDFNGSQYNASRLRRLRNLNTTKNRISSPSSITISSMKSNSNDQQTPETHRLENANDNEKMNEQRRCSKSLSSQFSTTTIINDRSPTSYQSRKTFKKNVPYSSSEEGEVEEIPSDHYVLDDEKHRAKHEDLNRESNGMFSSESEIYNDNHDHFLSLKNEGTFSDESGHVSDHRPMSRESLLNSEPEHEWPKHN